jgi:transposase
VQSKIGEAIRYTLSNWELLSNYLKDGRIEIDNNLLENAIRPFAIGRKNWLFHGSPAGAKAGAIFYSLIETCKVNNVEPYKYLCAMLNRIRECVTDDDYHKLLPQFIVCFRQAVTLRPNCAAILKVLRLAVSLWRDLMTQ